MALKVICQTCGSEFKTYPSVGQKFCSMACRNASYIGRHPSESTRAKMSAAKVGKVPVHHFRSGPEHPFWNPVREAIPFIETPEYKALRLRVLERDDYRCQRCGVRGQAGIRPILHVHHIKPRSTYPELALVDSNCQTVCVSCHKQTDSYLNRWGTSEDAIRKTREAHA